MFRVSILNQHLIFLRSLKEPFGGNSVDITDCRASSLLKTVPGCRALSNSGTNLFNGCSTALSKKITIATVKLVGNFGKAYHHILKWVLHRFCN